jgi:hypothetical protein
MTYASCFQPLTPANRRAFSDIKNPTVQEDKQAIPASVSRTV